jgi:WD40 repeat protein
VLAVALPGGTAAAFSPHGQILATGNADGTVRLWDVTAHRQITALTRPAGAVNSVAFSPDGKTLATGNADHTVRLWDVAYLMKRGTAPVRIGGAVTDTGRVGTIRARSGLPEDLPVTGKSPAAPT